MFIALAASVVLAGSMQAASDQEKDAAAEAYMTCLLKAAAKLDNGAAPEGHVAAGVAESCQADLQEMKALYARGETAELAQQISDEFDGLQQRSSARAVDIVRSRRGPPRSGS